MTRVTVSFPEELAHILADEARRRHSSVSAIVREALVQHLGLEGGDPREIPFAGIGSSGTEDLGTNAEGHLTDSWGEQLDRERS